MTEQAPGPQSYEQDEPGGGTEASGGQTRRAKSGAEQTATRSRSSAGGGSSGQPPGGQNGSSGGGSREAQLLELKRMLRELQEETQEAQQTIDSKKQQVTALQKDLAALEKSSMEADKTVEEYAGALAQNRTKLEALQAYAAIKASAIEAQLPEGQADKIKAAMETIDGEIEDKWGRVQALEAVCDVSTADDCQTSVQFTRLQHDNSLSGPKGRDARQRAYDDANTRRKKVEGWLKDADNLKKQIEAEEDQGRAARAYVLIQDLQRLLDKTEDKLVDAEAMRAELDKAWSELNTAQQTLRDHKTAWTERQAELDATRTQLDQARAQRLERIHEALPA